MFIFKKSSERTYVHQLFLITMTYTNTITLIDTFYQYVTSFRSHIVLSVHYTYMKTILHHKSINQGVSKIASVIKEWSAFRRLKINFESSWKSEFYFNNVSYLRHYFSQFLSLSLYLSVFEDISSLFLY